MVSVHLPDPRLCRANRGAAGSAGKAVACSSDVAQVLVDFSSDFFLLVMISSVVV